MDAAPEDGPVSVAYGLKPALVQIRPERPCPHTRQYLRHSSDAAAKAGAERKVGGQPRQTADICGWVIATESLLHSEEANRQDAERMNVHLNQFRLVFQCISGWALMLWRSEEEFEQGIFGKRGSPRAVAWFDLRRAFDVHVEAGDASAYAAPHRLTVMMRSGNYYFCLELPEDVPIWYEAIRRVIQDAHWQDICARDIEVHRRKRWPAACGVADALLVRGAPLGERALAILFHAYDIDFDGGSAHFVQLGTGYLQVGELMMLLQELVAALLHDEGRSEASERDAAVLSAASRVSEDLLFDCAMGVRRRCCPQHDGKVRKGDFIRCAPEALVQAVAATGVDMGAGVGGAHGGPGIFGALASFLPL